MAGQRDGGTESQPTFAVLVLHRFLVDPKQETGYTSEAEWKQE